MHRDLLPGIPFSFENWEHCTLKLPAPTLLRRFHPSAPTVCDPHLLPTAKTIPGELSAMGEVGPQLLSFGVDRIQWNFEPMRNHAKNCFEL